MKTIKITILFFLLLAFGLFLFFKLPNKNQEKKQVIQPEKLGKSTVSNTILSTNDKLLKKVNDTTVVFYFKDLSDVYN